MAEENKQGNQKKGGSKINFGKIIPIVLMLINMIGVGVGAFFTFRSTVAWERPKVVEQDLKHVVDQKIENNTWHPIMYTLEPFTINLDGLPQRSLHIEINLRMLGEDGFEEVINLGPEARDTIIKLLNSKTFNDLETIQGKLFLKDQISVAINSLLRNGVVKDVYFTQFNVAVR